MSESAGFQKLLFWAYRIIRISLGSVFVVSGCSKLMDPQSFAIIIGSYGLFSDSLILPAALGLSLLELLAGAALICDIKYALETIPELLVVFMGIRSYGLWLELDVDCGCFAASDPESHAFHSLRPALYRDAAMLAGIAYLYFSRWHQSNKPI